MKNIITLGILIVLSCSLNNLKAQDATAKLNEAESSYSSHQLQNTRDALQEAIMEINKAIGKDILDMLPRKIKNLACNEKDDNITGAAGFAGLFVNRSYGTSDSSNAKIEVMGDSPMISSINAILSLPAIMMTDKSSKKITVSGYKALLKKESSENQVTGYTLQIPVNQTLLTFEVRGIKSESEVVAIANSLPLDKISKLSQ
jgi:hypothetical protein